jgi:hypothetical protein
MKRPEREPDHSHPSSATVKNAWSFTSTPLYAFKALHLILSTGRIIFTFHFESILMRKFKLIIYCDNIARDLKDIKYKCVEWIQLASDRVQWRALVSMVWTKGF